MYTYGAFNLGGSGDTKPAGNSYRHPPGHRLGDFDGPGGMLTVPAVRPEHVVLVAPPSFRRRRRGPGSSGRPLSSALSALCLDQLNQEIVEGMYEIQVARLRP